MTSPHNDPGEVAVVVAVDGPSGSGKSSVSREVALRLGLRYLDTGSMYRGITLWLLEQGLDVSDPSGVAQVVGQPTIVVGTDPAHPCIEVAGVDVSRRIREDDVTASVSAVSAVPEVRARMVQLQRALIGAGGIVVEGRDIGSVVSPEAQVKIFLTASEQVRAQRRAAEHSADDADTTRVAINRRDQMDSTRRISPLSRAIDAVEIDATQMSVPEVVERVVGLVRARVPATLHVPRRR